MQEIWVGAFSKDDGHWGRPPSPPRNLHTSAKLTKASLASFDSLVCQGIHSFLTNLSKWQILVGNPFPTYSSHLTDSLTTVLSSLLQVGNRLAQEANETECSNVGKEATEKGWGMYNQVQILGAIWWVGNVLIRGFPGLLRLQKHFSASAHAWNNNRTESPVHNVNRWNTDREKMKKTCKCLMIALLSWSLEPP